MNSCASAAAKSSCLTLCDPIDGSPPGSPVPGILQARTLEWVAISFSNAWKWKVKVKLLSRVWLLRPHGLQPSRLPHPWDFPGKSTGVGWHCLHQHFRLGMVNYGRLSRPKSMVYLYIPKSKIKKLKKKTYQIAIKHFLERLPVRCV